MTIEAKPVVRNKYWIVEDDGRKIGTIQAAEDGVVLVKDNRRLKYPSIKVLGTAHNIRFVPGQKKQTASVDSVYDYPSRGRPYNAIYDLRLKLPLYTASKKSKSYYCAGFYLINLGPQWMIEFCPKKIILKRNQYLGPFKSKDQAQGKLTEIASLSTHK
jgi:hypothetical protein